MLLVSLGDIVTTGAADSAAQLGRGIRKLRKKKGWTQDRLAEKSNINRASLNALELGKSNPSFILVENIARSLGITVSGVFAEGRISLKVSDEVLRNALAHNVKERRVQLGLTRKELGERVNLLPQYLSTTENARRLPNLPNVIKIAQSLEIKPSRLFEVHDEGFEKWSHFIDPEDVCERIKQVRISMGLSLTAISKRSGIEVHHLTKIEGKKLTPNITTVQAFCAGVRLHLGEILD